MKHGPHGPAPMSFDLDAPPSSHFAVARFIKLLRLLWESDPQLSPVARTASVASSPTRFHPVRISDLLFFFIQYSDIHDPPRQHGRTRLIKTLDPAKFRQTGQTTINISGWPILHVDGPDIHKVVRPKFYIDEGDSPPPANTTGYFYFRPAEANRPRVSGGLRFRICPPNGDFATGKDLTRADGTVCEVPTVTLTQSRSRPLFDKAVEDGFISQDIQCFQIDASLLNCDTKEVDPSWLRLQTQHAVGPFHCAHSLGGGNRCQRMFIHWQVDVMPVSITSDGKIFIHPCQGTRYNVLSAKGFGSSTNHCVKDSFARQHTALRVASPTTSTHAFHKRLTTSTRHSNFRRCPRRMGGVNPAY